MGSIAGLQIPSPEIGVATSSGRAYYRISNLLKRIGIPFADLISIEQPFAQFNELPIRTYCYLDHNFKIIITTRKERFQFNGDNIVCEEDLGNDVGLAKEKLISILYPPKPSDLFVVGIDPGERTGVAAFINDREVESSVFPTIEATITRVSALVDNAPEMRRIVKIGCGNLYLAKRIAKILGTRFESDVEINLVNESGTSVLKRKGNPIRGTRDQRAARLIAFRDGQLYK